MYKQSAEVANSPGRAGSNVPRPRVVGVVLAENRGVDVCQSVYRTFFNI